MIRAALWLALHGWCLGVTVAGLAWIIVLAVPATGDPYPIIAPWETTCGTCP